MSEQTNLDNYKQQVRAWLLTNGRCSAQEAEELMNLYEDDFPEFLEAKFEPVSAGSAMMFGY